MIKLQKERVITIKPCDKGAGIIILDFEEYMRSREQHLNSQQKQEDETYKPYYCKVETEILELAKTKIHDVIEEAFDNEFIKKDEFESMNPFDKQPGKFYQLFKVHKQHTVGSAPPERPIISGSGSITENISLFVEHHIKNLANKHHSYLQDTPDFLRSLEDLKLDGNLPENSFLVTIDVSALYTNIPQDEGIEAVTEALEERIDKEVPTIQIRKSSRCII